MKSKKENEAPKFNDFLKYCNRVVLFMQPAETRAQFYNMLNDSINEMIDNVHHDLSAIYEKHLRIRTILCFILGACLTILVYENFVIKEPKEAKLMKNPNMEILTDSQIEADIRIQESEIEILTEERNVLSRNSKLHSVKIQMLDSSINRKQNYIKYLKEILLKRNTGKVKNL